MTMTRGHAKGLEWGKFRHRGQIVVCVILRHGPGWYRIADEKGGHLRIASSEGWVRLLPGPTLREIEEYVNVRWPDTAEQIMAEIREADAKDRAVV